MKLTWKTYVNKESCRNYCVFDQSDYSGIIDGIEFTELPSNLVIDRVIQGVGILGENRIRENFENGILDGVCIVVFMLENGIQIVHVLNDDLQLGSGLQRGSSAIFSFNLDLEFSDLFKVNSSSNDNLGLVRIGNLQKLLWSLHSWGKVTSIFSTLRSDNFVSDEAVRTFLIGICSLEFQVYGSSFWKFFWKNYWVLIFVEFRSIVVDILYCDESTDVQLWDMVVQQGFAFNQDFESSQSLKK